MHLTPAPSSLWIVYEFAPQDLGRTLRDLTIARSHADIKASSMQFKSEKL
jgi:hypothetical protein